ncbi:MAG: hypothetical protein HQL72_12350 [Magnetococcales bacterium]|nr:hypothetical protein [Magnetococcales bacterium]
MDTTCSRCHRALPALHKEGICPSCQKTIELLGLKVPGVQAKAKKIGAERVCPDCRGSRERFHEPHDRCCGQGCCYRTCATCGGSGFVS